MEEKPESGFTQAIVLPCESPHLRLMRRRLDKEAGRHLFSIPDQDVNNVPPSKQAANSPYGNAIVSSAHFKYFLQKVGE